MPRSIPAPNFGRLFTPPPTGSRLWRMVDLFSETNIRLYRLSGGRIGGRMGRAPVLLLHHVGRRSGTHRVTPVLFLADGERLVVVGSKGGAAKHPAWFTNLMANPETTVEVGRRRVRVKARRAEEDERAAYWPRLLEMYPSFGLYQERTDRVLPVAVLEPAGDA
jgi:deazaflavin-dependent oxidoreductase (nitroreductase family)